VRRAGSTLWLLLLAVVAIQIAAPTPLASLNGTVSYQDPEADSEPVEPSEADSQQSPLEFCGAIALRIRRPEADFIRRFVGKSPRHGWRSAAGPSIPAELLHRNGVGGPLRC